ncbi:MAG: hypothetical protein ABR552_05490 [Actinomycetota bacterium]|nr:hypothetical protein [Actinomycetota bacterium]
MKRLALATLIVATIAIPTASRAESCVAAGSYDYATVTFTSADNHTLTFELKEFGNALAPTANACSDASVGTTDRTSTLTLKVDGTTKCERSVARAGFDPFVFGANTNGLPAGACGAALDWSTLSLPASTLFGNLPYVPDRLPAGIDGGIVYAPAYAVVVPVSGTYYGLVTASDGTVPDNTFGFISHGVGVGVTP